MGRDVARMPGKAENQSDASTSQGMLEIAGRVIMYRRSREAALHTSLVTDLF